MMAMTYYEIPLSANHQRFYITLAGVQYQVQVIYRNANEGGWVLDLFDSAGNQILCGVPLVTGANLLSQYPDLGIAGGLYVTTDADPYAVPTYDNLGSTSHLYFGVSS